LVPKSLFSVLEASSLFDVKLVDLSLPRNYLSLHRSIEQALNTGLLVFVLIPAKIDQETRWKCVLDFIVGLPMTTRGNNTLLTVTDRFSKYVKLVPGTEKSSAKDWADRYWKNVYRSWGVPHRLISDRDPKFTSEFWKELFSKCGVKLNLTTAYHPSADGQAERSNQTVETALRCLLVGRYEESWDNLLTDVEFSFLNTSTNAFSDVSPFEVLYGVKPKIPLRPNRQKVFQPNGFFRRVLETVWWKGVEGFWPSQDQRDDSFTSV
jgi:hypothetical protein